MLLVQIVLSKSSEENEVSGAHNASLFRTHLEVFVLEFEVIEHWLLLHVESSNICKEIGHILVESLDERVELHVKDQVLVAPIFSSQGTGNLVAELEHLVILRDYRGDGLGVHNGSVPVVNTVAHSGGESSDLLEWWEHA